jgi:hypothetical protein
MGQRIYWNRGDYEIKETLVQKRQLGREDSRTEETMVRRRSWDKEERETEETVGHDAM